MNNSSCHHVFTCLFFHSDKGLEFETITRSARQQRTSPHKNSGCGDHQHRHHTKKKFKRTEPNHSKHLKAPTLSMQYLRWDLHIFHMYHALAMSIRDVVKAAFRAVVTNGMQGNAD